MSFFLSIFRSQMPNIVRRLKDIRNELDITKKNIEQLIILEQNSVVKETKTVKHVEIIETAVNCFGIAMWAKSANGRFLYVNKSCCSLILKCTPEEALNMRNGDFKKDALSVVCMRSDQQVLKSRTTKRFIESAVYQGNKSIWLDVVKSPIFQGNLVTGTVGSAVDITNSVPETIKKARNGASSIEIPFDTTMSYRQLTKILERRKIPRAGLK